MESRRRMQDLPTYFRALSDRKRFRILVFLSRHDAATVKDLGDELHLSQPLISWHLRALRRAGLVKTRRAGRQVWCSLNRQSFTRYERKLFETLGIDDAAARGDDEPSSTQPLEPAAHS